MSIRLELPKVTELRPRITVVGVGGAGGNAVNNMIASGLTGVEFVVANTDAQALAASSAELRIQLGANLTEGLGAGSKPEIGQAAAEEAIDDIRGQIAGSHMVFIAAGMGGGTGTGAAAVIARVARELDILVVAIVTKPFQFEGARRMRMAEAGIAELKRSVDTMIVIPNQNLFRVATERTTFAEAFVMADQVLYSGIACIVDLIVKEGLINLDFADVRTVLSGMGSAVMGTGEASGDRRAVLAAEEAISNPLLDEVSLRGARGLLLSIIGGKNLTLYEVDEAASRVRMEVDPEANIIVGATFDDSLEDRVRVSIVASGMDHQYAAAPRPAEASARPGTHRDATSAAINRDVQPSIADVAASLGPQGSIVRGRPPAEPQRASHAAVPVIAPGSAFPPSPGQSQRDADDYARAMNEAYPHTAHGASSSQLAPPRGGWESPDGVMIEPHAQLPAGPTLPPPLPQQTRLDPQPMDPRFTPQAPADTRRAGRRMPELNDFPEVAQRDYRAKAPSPDGNARDVANSRRGESDEPVARRKQGLFERFSSFARRESDDDRSDERLRQSVKIEPDTRREAAARSTRPTPGPTAARGPRPPDQDIEFPGLFDKKRR